MNKAHAQKLPTSIFIKLEYSHLCIGTMIMPMATRGRSCPAQSQPFILSTRLSDFKNWKGEGVGEDKEKERRRRTEYAKLVDPDEM